VKRIPSGIIMKKSTALARFARSRTDFRRALQQMSEQDMLSTPIEGIWVAKDLIGHLTAWEQLLVQPLQSLVDGGAFVPEIISDHDAFNMQQAGKRKDWTIIDVIRESDTVRTAILDALSKVTEEQSQLVLPAPWGGEQTLTHLIDGLRWHEDEHAQCIHRWVNQNSPQNLSKDK
jgi:hypothetical protein